VSNVWIGDADSFFAPTPAWSGDFNGDGVVDVSDYAVWRSTLGSNILAADGNGDGIINAADLAVWSANLGRVLGGGAGQNVAVPEPAMLTLFFAFAAVLLMLRIRS